MKEVKTELLLIPLRSKMELVDIFRSGESILIRERKKPLRMVLLDIKAKSAKLLVSFIYDKN